MSLDYGLYLVTDRGLSKGRRTFDIVRQAIQGGVTVVQLREKTASTREFLEEAEIIISLCHDNNVPLIINDRLDIALAIDADGVHLGQDDMPIHFARKIIGKNKIIGVSAFTENEALEARRNGADYIGVSPIFTTPTKPELEQGLGLEGLRKIKRVVDIPLVAIGGLDRQNAYDIIRAGAAGVAVVSAIVSADDPERAARDIKSEIERARKEHA